MCVVFVSLCANSQITHTQTQQTKKNWKRCIYAKYPSSGPKPLERLELLAERIKEDNIDIVFIQELAIFGLGFLTLSGNWTFFTNKMKELGMLFFTI